MSNEEINDGFHIPLKPFLIGLSIGITITTTVILWKFFL